MIKPLCQIVHGKSEVQERERWFQFRGIRPFDFPPFLIDKFGKSAQSFNIQVSDNNRVCALFQVSFSAINVAFGALITFVI